jgi:hypothetical protein
MKVYVRDGRNVWLGNPNGPAQLANLKVGEVFTTSLEKSTTGYKKHRVRVEIPAFNFNNEKIYVAFVD